MLTISQTHSPWYTPSPAVVSKYYLHSYYHLSGTCRPGAERSRPSWPQGLCASCQVTRPPVRRPPCLGAIRGHSEGLPLPCGNSGLCGMPQRWLPELAATQTTRYPHHSGTQETRLQNSAVCTPTVPGKASGMVPWDSTDSPSFCESVGLAGAKPQAGQVMGREDLSGPELQWQTNSGFSPALPLAYYIQ